MGCGDINGFESVFQYGLMNLNCYDLTAVMGCCRRDGENGDSESCSLQTGAFFLQLNVKGGDFKTNKTME
jgi:hypothetical protein